MRISFSGQLAGEPVSGLAGAPELLKLPACQTLLQRCAAASPGW
jgi:hypothetical protein